MFYELGEEPDTWHRYRLIAFGIVVWGWMIYAGCNGHVQPIH